MINDTYTRYTQRLSHAFLLRLGTRGGCPLFNTVPEVLASTIGNEEELKNVQARKSKFKLSINR